MSGATSVKRSNSEESFSLKSPKICRMDVSVKENTPPEDLCNSGRVTPTKCSSQIREEPITPNANIKLLTSLAATLDYANLCSTPKTTKFDENCRIDNSNEEDTVLGSTFKPSRKEKSLALVCFKFLSIYPLDPDPRDYIIVSLDEASCKLKVERRRLYDIVNVLESIEMLSKVAKNRYVWYGRKYLVNALNCIKNSAICEGIAKKLKYVHDLESSSSYRRQSCILDEVQNFSKQLDWENESAMNELICTVTMQSEARKEKSLASMSQKFLMLFLVSPSKVISLGEAAKVLNGFQKYNKGAQIKTQIRRLYDIANVLSSIQLIEKKVVKGGTGKKPAFRYIGPDLEKYNNKENFQASSSSKIKPRSLIRHSSFQEICEVAELEHQKLCLLEAPKSAPPFEKSLEKEPFCMNFNVDCKNNHFIGPKAGGMVPKLPKIPIAKNPRNTKVQAPVFVKNGSYFVLNNSARITPPGTIFILNSCHPTKLKDEKNTKNSDKASQTTELSLVQDSNNVNHLNISFISDNFSASNSMSNCDSDVQQFNNKSNEICSTVRQPDLITLAKDFRANDSESDLSSTASQIIRIDSPLSIPSGYATPIQSSMSDIASFPSNREVDLILKKIENCSKTVSSSELPTIGKSTAKQETGLQSFKNCMPVKGVPLLHHNSDSCSNDSLNAEVTNILKEVPFGASATTSRPHSFLIDEKTILSPIKKPEECTKKLYPSPLMTPPYISTDAIFVYHPITKFQNTTGKLEASLLKIKKNICDKNK